MAPRFRMTLAAIVAVACGGGGGSSPSAPSAHCWPSMSDPQPRGTLAAGTRTATLSMKTDRSAVCRHSSIEGLHYTEMESAFTATGGTQHSGPLPGLADGEAYRHFAKCEIPGTDCTNPHDLVFLFDVAAPAAVAAPAR